MNSSHSNSESEDSSSNGPSPHPSAWRDYFENQFSRPITDEAAQIIAVAVGSAAIKRESPDNLITVNTKELLLPLTARYAPLETLYLGNHVGAFSGRPPWYEPQWEHDGMSYEALEAFGNARPSVEFASVLETAASLTDTTPQFHELTPWHLAFALVSSRATGFKFQLEAQNSSLRSAADVLRRNIRNHEPALEPLFRWSELDLTDDSEMEKSTEKPYTVRDSKVWSRAFDKIRNPKDFKWSTSCGQILDNLWHAHGNAASFARKSEQLAGTFNPRLTPRGLFLQCLIHGLRKPESIAEQDLLSRIASAIGKDEEAIRENLRTELHRGPESTNESNPVATQRLLAVINQAKAIRDDVDSDNYVCTRHLIAALLLPYEGSPTGAFVLVGEEAEKADRIVAEFATFVQSPAANSVDEPPSNWDQWLNQLRNSLPTSVGASESPTPESESQESNDSESIDSNARRGPRSSRPHHPPNASAFRRLVESERKQFDEFRLKASLNLSHACWNSNVIAWEDTAALCDSDRDPVVTCRSVFIGFLDTGLAERQLVDEGSLPAALARALEMSSERLTKLRIAAFHGAPPKNESSLLRADAGLLALWQHAARISHQCTEDKMVASRHLLAAFLFLYENDPEVGSQLDSVEFNPELSLAVLQKHLGNYETVKHPGWRAFFQRLGVTGSSTSIEFGIGITPSRYNSLCLGIEKTSAAIAEIFRSARDPQSIPDPKDKERERVSDFVFALYGPWGRGKSTLMGRVAAILCHDPDSEKAGTDAKGEFVQKSPNRVTPWLSGVFRGYPKVTQSYAALEFSAWKYPSRPEVWVHLYERVRELAESNSLLQKLRLSFRLGLLESGWWPLISGFILLAIPRLPIATWAGGIWKASGWLGCLLIVGFFLRVFRIGSLVGQRYMKIPSHADKLGLQAVVGRDLKNLLQVWISPPNAKIIDEKLSAVDFRWSRKGSWMSIVIIGLIGFSVWRACISIQLDHQSRQEKATALHSNQNRSPSNVSIQASVQYPMGELKFTIPASKQILQRQAPRVLAQDPFWIYVILITTGAFAIIAGWIITRPPKRNETLLLTVDDLDRCESDQMLAVIDSLRLFLDDQEMSQRLQMAMLLDRGLLQESLKSRISQAGIDRADDQNVRNFHRTHREKVFLCEFSMPPLQDHERNELLKSLFPDAELTDQRRAISTTTAPTETKLPDSLRKNDQSAPSGPARLTVPDPKTNLKPETQGSQESANVPGKPEADEKAARNKGATSSPTPEVKLSRADASALVHAISLIPSTELTPRSMLMLKVRFELVRLLLKHQLEDYKPDDSTLSGIATSLVQDLFPSLSLYSAPLPLEIKSVVDQVTSN